jgi:Na+-driven multidrug efflux pump
LLLNLAWLRVRRGFVAGVLIGVTLIALKQEVPKIFSHDPEVHKQCENLIPLVRSHCASTGNAQQYPPVT